jgi:hypothetical protein
MTEQELVLLGELKELCAGVPNVPEEPEEPEPFRPIIKMVTRDKCNAWFTRSSNDAGYPIMEPVMQEDRDGPPRHYPEAGIEVYVLADPEAPSRPYKEEADGSDPGGGGRLFMHILCDAWGHTFKYDNSKNGKTYPLLYMRNYDLMKVE